MKVQLMFEDSKAPIKAHETDAGFDIFAWNHESIMRGHRVTIRTGIKIAVPKGYYARIAPRSSMSMNGIDICAGVIDEGYRGEIIVLMANNSHALYTVNKGDKIAQIILEKISDDNSIEVVKDLDETERGTGGFGSTDKKRKK